MRPPETREQRRSFAEAAWRLGRLRGLKGLTVRALADAMGVNPARLYAHYEDKASLLAELRSYGHPMLIASLAEASHRDRSGDALLAMSLAYVDFMREHGWAYEADEPVLGGELDHRDAFIERALELLGGAHGSLRERATHLWLGLHALGLLLGRAPDDDRARDRHVVAAHAQALLRGIAQMPAEMLGG
ncbi:MAG: TetR/AcrR family transcriptional regulator [Deltaproteobacteria bacterium]|nr:TetR/AcrR family transcriptional regulator [Nannocystaceae bacterium]